VGSLPENLRCRLVKTEKPGAWYFPPLASLITSGGRLLLAMLDKCVQDLPGNYLFCDTDSIDPASLDLKLNKLKQQVAKRDSRNYIVERLRSSPGCRI